MSFSEKLADLFLLPTSFLLVRRDSCSSTHFHSERGEYRLPHIFIWLWQLACALCALRNANILHQDVKPQNCLLIENGKGVEELVLADFGVAKIAEDGPSGGGIVLPRPSVTTEEATDGRTAPASYHHVSIEMSALADRICNTVRDRAAKKWKQNDRVLFERFSRDVGGDLAKFMSHSIIDESSDMCK